MKTKTSFFNLISIRLSLILGLPLLILCGCSKSHLQKKADAWHAEYQQSSEGVSLGEIKQHEHVYASAGRMRANGPLVDENTLFEIGSITKVFTGILLADTVLQGKVQLDDSIGIYLPDGVLSDNSPLHSVTLLQLATHTSGLPYNPLDLIEGVDPQERFAHYSRERLFQYLGDFKEEDFYSHGHYSYSNLGFGLLGEILAIIQETDYTSLLEDRIFKPLKMDLTWVETVGSSVPELLKERFATGHLESGEPTFRFRFDALAGAGAIVSSVSDLMTFAEAHWSEDTPEHLKKSFSLAMQPHTKIMGLGWNFQDGACQHGGGTEGFRCGLIVNPDTQYARVSLRNSLQNPLATVLKSDFSDLVGFWYGELDYGTEIYHTVMHVTESGTAYQYSIEFGGAFMPNVKAVFKNNELFVSYPNASEYRATYKDGKLIGTLSLRDKDLKLNMEHSDNMPAALETIWDSIYQGDLESLEGFWSGNIGGESGLFVYIEISQLGDRHEMKIWNPGRNPFPFGVSKVEYNLEGKQNFKAEIGALKAVFNGSVDLNTKTISGIWSRGEGIPVVLTWSAQRPE